ncbi:MAG: hypothetical protein ACI9TF_001566 [Paracrocinitomix sp.]
MEWNYVVGGLGRPWPKAQRWRVWADSGTTGFKLANPNRRVAVTHGRLSASMPKAIGASAVSLNSGFEGAGTSSVFVRLRLLVLGVALATFGVLISGCSDALPDEPVSAERMREQTAIDVAERLSEFIEPREGMSPDEFLGSSLDGLDEFQDEIANLMTRDRAQVRGA